MGRFDTTRFAGRFARTRFSMSRLGSAQGAGGQTGGRPSEIFFTEPLASTSPVDNHTLVVVLRMNDVSSPDSPAFTVTGIRVTVEGKVAKLYVGPQDGAGDDADATSLTQVTFGGVAGVDPANATDVSTSDIVDFSSWNGSDNLIFSIYTGSTNAKVRNKSFTNFADLYATSGVDEAAQADKTGYTLTLENNLYCVRGVVVYGD